MHRLIVALVSFVLLSALTTPYVSAQSPTRPAAPPPTATTPRPTPPPVAPTPTPARPALTPTPTATKVGATASAPTPTRLPPSPTATRTPAPPPGPAAPGTVAGIPYDPAKDTTGARERVEAYRDEQMRNGVPQADAERIARSHFLWDCREAAKNCDQTGFDFTGVDVNDAHANFGYNPECEVWGESFTPWWGMWDPPADQPGCGGSGGTPGAPGGAGGGWGRFPSPSDIAKAVLVAVDIVQLLTKIIRAVYDILAGDILSETGAQIAAFLTKQPDLTTDRGGMRNIQELVGALQLAAVGACVVAFTITVVEFTLGRQTAPQDALGRLLAVLVAVGFYPTLVDWLLRGTNELTTGILEVGTDRTTPAFTGLLALLVPTTAPLWLIMGIIGVVLIIAVGVVKMIGFAFLILTYCAGPILLPLAIHPAGGRWVGLWAEHTAKVLLWPVVWALEFRVLGALTGGLTFIDGEGLALQSGALGALAALGMLVIIAYTPMALHTRFSVAGVARGTGQQLVRAADAGALFASGGTSHTFKAYAAKGFKSDKKGA